MIYEVEGSKLSNAREEVQADTHQEAAAFFRERNPDFRVQSVSEYSEHASGEWEAVALCEGCSVQVFESDDYATDNESGIYLCEICKSGE